MKKLLAFLIVFFSVFSSHAGIDPGKWRWYFLGYQSDFIYSSSSEACNAFLEWRKIDAPPPTYKDHHIASVTSSTCRVNFKDGYGYWRGGEAKLEKNNICPDNSTLSGSSCICNAGYAEDSASNSCIPVSCPAGQQSSALVPVAWARYYTGGTGSIPIEGGGTAEIVGEAKIPDSVCMGGCEYWNVGSVRSYISFDRPSGTGSYQVLNELNLETSGSECSEETNLSEPVEPAPVCNGVVGEVNGKKYCAPSDSGGGSGGEGGGTDPGEGGGTDPGEGGSTDPGEGGGNPPGGGSGGGTNPGGGSGGGDGDGEDGEGPGGGGGPGSGSEWSVPTFYESKYPDGMSGVWQSSGLAAAAGVFDGLAGAFVPPWSDTAGACQSFYLNLDIGIFNFGRFDISPPCFVWSFLWLCMQIGAIFLFRALVFGG